jgi:hypothetical protein
LRRRAYCGSDVERSTVVAEYVLAINAVGIRLVQKWPGRAFAAITGIGLLVLGHNAGWLSRDVKVRVGQY